MNTNITGTGEVHPSIPTIYKGTNLKSRLEAQCAYLLDSIGLEWQYEPKGYMLQGGLTYLPDFYVDAQRMFIECRGYESERGESQIEEFGKVVSEGQVGPRGQALLRFLVIQENNVCCYRPRQIPVRGTLIFCCSACQGWRFMGVGEEACPTCFSHSSSLTKAAVVSLAKGKILLNGIVSEYWDSVLMDPLGEV